MSNFARNITDIYGNNGRIWLEKLPGLADSLARKWQLGKVEAAPDLTYNAVYFSLSKPLILKIGPDLPALHREMQALTYFKGQGCVKLIDYDNAIGALLLEKIQPGILLKSLYPHNDLEAVEAAAGIIQQFQKMPASLQTQQFPHVGDWLGAFDKAGTLPLELVAQAKALVKELLATASEEIVLHGDLHHDNILSQTKNGGEKIWVAIDPKGVRSEPAFETACFVRNPLPQLRDNPQVVSLINARINSFSRLLGIDAQRIRQWNFVSAILSACWSVEDNQDPSYSLFIANILKCSGTI